MKMLEKIKNGHQTLLEVEKQLQDLSDDYVLVASLRPTEEKFVYHLLVAPNVLDVKLGECSEVTADSIEELRLNFLISLASLRKAKLDKLVK